MKQYEVIELVFKKKIELYSEVRVDLEGDFQYGDTHITVKGFYAGDNVFKIRFMPEYAGKYHYKIRGIINEEGDLMVEDANAGRHGIPRADGTHVRFSDGSYFYPFGTTVYGLAHQSNAVTEETFATLADAPFNKIRICVFPKHYQYNHNEPLYYPFCTLPGKNIKNAVWESGEYGIDTESLWDVEHPDYVFWDAFEEKLKRFESMGIVVDLILFHPYDRWGFSKMSMEKNFLYLDYLLRRFGAFPNLMWSIANEYDLVQGRTTEEWYKIESYIAENDPYHHMMSNHNCFVLYDYARENITHVSIQTRSPVRVPELLKFGKPVFYDECAYEGNLEETFGSLTGEEMSDRFWKVMVTGGYCTHGETFLDYQQDNIEDAVIFWAKGGKLIGKSPERIAFLKKFVESLPGPIEPVTTGFDFATLFRADRDTILQILQYVPEEHKHLLLPIADMDDRERQYHLVTEMTYAGHVGEDVYIFYFGRDVHGRVTLNLPQTKKYRIEAIDTWNMKREILAEGMNGVCRLIFPQKQWMAIVAIGEK